MVVLLSEKKKKSEKKKEERWDEIERSHFFTKAKRDFEFEEERKKREDEGSDSITDELIPSQQGSL